MRSQRLVLVHDQQTLKKEPALAPEPETHPLPGSGRRDWVYREISQLGAEPAPRVERD